MAHRISFCSLALGLLASAAAADVTVYRSVDPDGTVTFSDQPPPGRSAEVLSVDVPRPGEPGLLEERLESMRETTDRMVEDRREREAARAALAAARRPDPTPAPATVIVSGAPLAWPVYTRPWWRPGPRPYPLRGRHGPAVPTPPLRGDGILQPGNHQLMRPIVSSRR